MDLKYENHYKFNADVNMISKSERRDQIIAKMLQIIDSEEEFEDQEKLDLKEILKKESAKLRVNSAPTVLHTESPNVNKRLRAISVGPKHNVPGLNLSRDLSRSRTDSLDSPVKSFSSSSTPGTPTSKLWNSLTPNSSPKNTSTSRGDSPSPKINSNKHREGFFKRLKNSEKCENEVEVEEPYPLDEDTIKNYLVLAEDIARKQWKKEKTDFKVAKEKVNKDKEKHAYVKSTIFCEIPKTEYKFLIIPPNKIDSSEVKIYFMEHLGEGDNGQAYRAFDLRNKKFCTAKLFKKIPYRGSNEKNIGENEVEPNKSRGRYIGKYYLSHHRLFILKSYAPGQELYRLINNEVVVSRDISHFTRLPIEPLFKLKIICGMIREILFFHECGFLHRDLKPKNFIIAKDGSVKLIDEEWSIPKEGKNLEDYCKITGTFGYQSYNIMPTELKDIQSFTSISDWYVFGIILAELISAHYYKQKLMSLDHFKMMVQHADIKKMLADILDTENNTLTPNPLFKECNKESNDFESNIENTIYNHFIFPQLKELARSFFSNTKDDDFAAMQLITLEKLLELSVNLKQQYKTRHEMDLQIYSTLDELNPIEITAYSQFLQDINQLSRITITTKYLDNDIPKLQNLCDRKGL